MNQRRKHTQDRTRSETSTSGTQLKSQGLTDAQIQLVQDTWAIVAPNAEVVASLFYGRLFELDPELRPLFTSDIKEQGLKLTKMIGVAVNGLNKLETIVPAVQELGRRHVDYGVTDEHYDTVGAALLWTLEKGLADEYNEDVNDAWTQVYGLLARTMIDASHA